MNLKRAAIVLTVAAVLILVYWPTLRWLVNSWLSNPYYSHGFLVPLVSGFFVWTKRRELRGGEPSIAGAFVITAGAFLYIMGFAWAMRFLPAISLPVVLGGISLSFLGIRATKAILFPLCFLIFMMPLPPIQEMGYTLQEWSVHSSAWILSTLGLSVTTVGPEIHLEDTVFTIGLACSGINSLIAMMALAAVYTFVLVEPFHNRAVRLAAAVPTGPLGDRLRLVSIKLMANYPARAFLFAAAFPMALLGNILRIVSIILIANYWGVDAASGLYHDISSPLFFILSFLLLMLLGRIIGCKLALAARKK
jgi:exosortase